MSASGLPFDDVRLISTRAVAHRLGMSNRHAAALLDARLLGPVYVADGARYVASAALDELAARPLLQPKHPAALVVRVLGAVEEDQSDTGRPWAGYRADLPPDVRRTGVAWYWRMKDEAAQAVVDQQMPIVATVRGYVVDVFAANGFHRNEKWGVAFHPIDVDGAPFIGTVLRLGPGGSIVWLPADHGGAQL